MLPTSQPFLLRMLFVVDDDDDDDDDDADEYNVIFNTATVGLEIVTPVQQGASRKGEVVIIKVSNEE